MDNSSRLILILDKLKNLTKFQKIMLVGLIILIITIGALLLLNREKSEVLKTVGEDNILSTDISAIKKIQYDRTEAEILDQVSKESKILQDAVQEGLVEVPADYFSDKTPINNAERQKFISQAEEEYEKQSMQVQGAIINVFFYNQKPADQLTFDQADSKALELMTAIRERIISGQMQPSTAIAALAQHPDVAKLDWNGKFNTGFTFDKQVAWRLTSDSLYLATLQKMTLGKNRQVSEIVRYPGPKDQYPESYFNSEEQNGYYMIFVLDDKVDGYLQSFDEWSNNNE